MTIAVAGVSLPSFLFGALAILFFCQYLNWLPSAFWDGWSHKILPSFVLGFRPMAIIARQTRSSVLENLKLDYIRTARAKGLNESKVLFIHTLKNSLLPVLALLAPLSAQILTGSFVIEYMFSVPGLGGHYVNAVLNRDYPLIMGVTLLYAVFLVSASMGTDILYTFLDPRVKQLSLIHI